MTAVWTIRYHGRRYLRRTAPPTKPERGWRNLTWTADLSRAEKFATKVEAEFFAQGLRGDGFVVTPVYPGYQLA